MTGNDEVRGALSAVVQEAREVLSNVQEELSANGRHSQRIANLIDALGQLESGPLIRFRHGDPSTGKLLQPRTIAPEARLQSPPSVSGELEAAQAEIARLSGLLNTPELHDFAKAVVLEAAHQRERWASDHDAGKTAPDWFWLVGYLAGKALHSQMNGNDEKAMHHTISTAAALANWHAAISGESNAMRPGIEPPPHAAPVSNEGDTK